MEAVKCPAGLGAAGRKLWRGVLADFELNAGEVALLERACRVSDRLAKVDALVATFEPVVSAPTGHVRPSPLYAVAAQQERVLARLLDQLALPQREVVIDAAREQWRRQSDLRVTRRRGVGA